jgi:hypothetical protein
MLSYVVEKPGEIEKLFRVTGLDRESLPSVATSTAGLACFVEFACQNESLVEEFCTAHGVPAEHPMRALAILQHNSSASGTGHIDS